MSGRVDRQRGHDRLGRFCEWFSFQRFRLPCIAPENLLRGQTRRGEFPTARTLGNVSTDCPRSLGGGDQHVDTLVASELRVAECADLDPIGRNAGLDQRITNDLDPTVAQTAVKATLVLQLR